MSFISSVSSNVLITETTQPSQPSYPWPETIHATDMSFQLASSTKNPAFFAICEMYELSEEDLKSHLEGMVVWCIYNQENQPVGAIQLDFYPTLQDLQKQVTDEKLAGELVSSKKSIELSYALTEQSRGKGLGSKAVEAFVKYALSCPWGNQLFAVVDDDNAASIRIVQKNGFSLLGKYQHTETQENILLFAL